MIGGLSWPSRIEIRKEPLIWLLVGLGSLFLFLFVMFPYGALQSRILAELARGTGWEVRAADWSKGIPLAVEWHDLTWTKPGKMSIPVQVMRFSIGLIRTVMGQPTMDALVQFPGSGQVGGGRVTGAVTTASWSFLGPVSFWGHVQQVDLMAVAKPYVKRGLLQADITHRWENREKEGIVFKGDGSWKVEVRDLELERIPMGTGFVPSLTFARVNTLLKCRDSVCDIIEFKGDGPDGTVTAQGRILLQQPLQSSTLDLSVTVLAGSGWAQKARNLPIPPISPGTPLTFKLVGSVANPNLTL
jgi:type II secretion system protein N